MPYLVGWPMRVLRERLWLIVAVNLVHLAGIRRIEDDVQHASMVVQASTEYAESEVIRRNP